MQAPPTIICTQQQHKILESGKSDAEWGSNVRSHT